MSDVPRNFDERRSPGVVAIAATFTAEPLLPLVNLLLGECGVPLRSELAPYHQVFQQLLSPTSLLASNAGGINVLIVRPEDFVRECADPARTGGLEQAELERACGTLQSTAAELADALGQFSHRAASPAVLVVPRACTAPDTPLGAAVERARTQLLQSARELPALQVLEAADIDALCQGDCHDRLRDELAHIPYTEEYYAALALALARRIHALRVPAHKVLVLDCDNTLWRGVVGEDGVDGIVISEELRQLQRFALQLQTRGALLCLVSKNAEQDVLEVFRRRSDMALPLDCIVAHRINWQGKADNIASLARELNLGLDSFVFLDDNPIECAQVQAQLPQVVTLQLPAEHELAPFLDHLWTFDKVALTREDTQRTALYRENLARQRSEEAAHDIGDFIASLGLVIDIAAPGDADWPRLAQLTQKTNQFNFTTVRRSEAELRSLQAGGRQVLQVRVRDRFGDYGVVGVMIAEPAATSLIVDTLLLSCRALGRGVEHAMLARLGELAGEHSLAHVELPYLRTPKNEPALAFADSVAAQFKSIDGEAVRYRVPVAQARAIRHRPGEEPAAVLNARRAEEGKTSGKASGAGVAGAARALTPRSEIYARVARTLTSGKAVLEILQSRGLRKRALPGRAEPPASELERELLTLWQQTLNLSELGVEDNYFALGGSSLMAARLFAEIARRFGVRLRLTTILDAPTVRALARHIQPQGPQRTEVLIELKAGAALNLFLVHDGDGETLLYRTLARHLPEALCVVGIEPRRLPHVPLALGSIPQMARFYIGEIRRRQPHGPYRLGGLCAGGVIAYEMARQLQQAGETVQLVAIFDAARPGARQRPGRLAQQRARRFEQLLSSVRESRGLLARSGALLGGTARKLLGFTLWQIGSRSRRLSARLRFALLRRQLARGAPWPARLPPLSVRDIYDCAEAQYSPQSLHGAGVVLLRASSGEGNDTPYRWVYQDDSLGWAGIVPDLQIIDVQGGHSSMLQEPCAASLAEWLTGRLLGEREPLRRSAPRG